MKKGDYYYNLGKKSRWFVDHRLGFILVVLAALALPVHLVFSWVLVTPEVVEDWFLELKMVFKAAFPGKSEGDESAVGVSGS